MPKKKLTIAFQWKQVGDDLAYVAEGPGSVGAIVFQRGAYWVAMVSHESKPLTRVFIDAESAKRQVEWLEDENKMTEALSLECLTFRGAHEGPLTD